MLNQIDDRTYLEPPDYESNAVFKCYWCNVGIFEGDEYYDIDGKFYCEECLNDNFKKHAEREGWE